MQLCSVTTAFESGKILLPLDVRDCSLEVFDWINRVAGRSLIRVVLLHVVTLDLLGGDNRLYDDLSRDAFARLQRLSGWLHPSVSTEVRVRLGRVADEVVLEATSQQPDLVILTARERRRLERSIVWLPRSGGRVLKRLALRLAAEARCDVVILPAPQSTDGELVWRASAFRRKRKPSFTPRSADSAYESPAP